MKHIAQFIFTYKGQTLVQTGYYNPETQEFIFPSGYIMPVNDDMTAYYLGQVVYIVLL